jgi:hypothetical protein
MTPMRLNTDDRICAICSEPIEPRAGNYNALYNLLTHAEAPFVDNLPPCVEILRALTKDYSRSKRGRWRTRAEVYKLLRGLQGNV